ncbi:MAG: hypothetical protein NVV74_14955 [Magnetospirillum sp.]|nr:hypothetical protein [Magnetospirillum sp.]
MRFGPLALALVLAAAAQPALAQNVPDQPAQAPAASQDPAQRFQAYVTSDGYKSSIGQLAIMGDTISAPDCKEHKPQERASMTIYGAPHFEAGVHPVSGLWVDRIKMNRCGATTFQNVLIQAQKDGQPPRMALMMPGSTQSNPPMQNLVMKDVLEGLAKNKCTDQTQIVPVDTKRDKETKPLKLDNKGMIVEGAWKETWTFKACGKTVNATVDFTSDGKGGLNHKVKL